MADAFLSALRSGDFESPVAMLDPDLEVKADLGVLPPSATAARGAQAWARQAITFARGAVFARVALVDGAVGIVIAPRGRLFRRSNSPLPVEKSLRSTLLETPHASRRSILRFSANDAVLIAVEA